MSASPSCVIFTAKDPDTKAPVVTTLWHADYPNLAASPFRYPQNSNVDSHPDILKSHSFSFALKKGTTTLTLGQLLEDGYGSWCGRPLESNHNEKGWQLRHKDAALLPMVRVEVFGTQGSFWKGMPDDINKREEFIRRTVSLRFDIPGGFSLLDRGLMPVAKKFQSRTREIWRLVTRDLIDICTNPAWKPRIFTIDDLTDDTLPNLTPLTTTWLTGDKEPSFSLSSDTHTDWLPLKNNWWVRHIRRDPGATDTAIKNTVASREAWYSGKQNTLVEEVYNTATKAYACVLHNAHFGDKLLSTPNFKFDEAFKESGLSHKAVNRDTPDGRRLYRAQTTTPTTCSAYALDHLLTTPPTSKPKTDNTHPIFSVEAVAGQPLNLDAPVALEPLKKHPLKLKKKAGAK